MKSFVLAVFNLIQIALTQSLFEQIIGQNANLQLETDVLTSPLSQRVQKNGFGYLSEEKIYSDSYREKIIKAPQIPFQMDYAQQEQFINKSAEFHKNLNANVVDDLGVVQRKLLQNGRGSV